MKEDCDCKKNLIDDKWPEKGDFGDKFLGDNTFFLINSIKKFIKSDSINHDAYFNLKMEEEILDNLKTEDTYVDYSYLDKNEQTLINHNDILLESEESESEESEEKEESEREEKEESEEKEEREILEEEKESYKSEIESYLDDLK